MGSIADSSNHCVYILTTQFSLMFTWLDPKKPTANLFEKDICIYILSYILI